MTKRIDIDGIAPIIGTLYRSGSDALVLEIGSRLPRDAAHYSDIDMISPADGTPAIYTRRNGTPYTDIERRGPKG